MQTKMAWEQLKRCLTDFHCSCEIENHCCFCEYRNLSEEAEVRMVAPFGSSEDEIAEFLKLAQKR